MDIKKELGASRRYNLHTHTPFCDGRAPMEDFVREAVRLGFTHLGFSPHSPLAIESPCNMERERVPHYFGEIERLRRVYGKQLRILAGMEIDYLSQSWGPHITYFRELPLDYRIGSVHFVPTRDGRMYVDIDGRPESFRRKLAEYFDGDLRYVVQAFSRQTREMILAGGFDIVGHLDKVGFNASQVRPGIEEEHWYRRLVDDIVDLIAERGLMVEVNTKAYSGPDAGRVFPSRRIISRLKAAGVPMIVNSDAHEPSLLDASRDEAFRLLAVLPDRLPG